MNNKALYKISYGLYLASVKIGDKTNACVVNTVTQVANSPNRIVISLNKGTYTNEVLTQTKKLVVTSIAQDTGFDTFERFGFSCGKEKDKFEGQKVAYAEGIPYIPEIATAYLVCDVISMSDLGSHTLFICEVVDGDVVSDKEPMTYSYYQAHVKPKPQAAKAVGYRCTICNYVYEGEELPSDIICPICKHPAADFEKM